MQCNISPCFELESARPFNNAIVTSQGFLLHVHLLHLAIKELLGGIFNNPTTFLLMLSFDLEA